MIVTLECTECRTNPHQRTPGVSRYTTEKNRRNVSGRLELRKHCRYCNKHTVHKETK